MTITKKIIVISDIHMTASDGLAIFRARDELRDFISYQAKQDGHLELVLLGDVLDYLSIKPYLCFTEAVAVEKTSAILEHNKEIFEAMRGLLQSGKTIVWCIGNHDIELLFKPVRTKIEEALFETGAPAEVKGRLRWHLNDSSLIYDLPGDEQIRLNHGNLADPWNRIDYKEAQQIADSGGSESYPYPPGSRLVANVLNKLREDGYGHVDLLKPEETVALPITFALWPDKIWQLLKEAFAAHGTQWIGALKMKGSALLGNTSAPTFSGGGDQGQGATGAAPTPVDLVAEGLVEALRESQENIDPDDFKAWVATLEAPPVPAAAPSNIPTFGFEILQPFVGSLFRGGALIAARLDQSFELDSPEAQRYVERAKDAFDAHKTRVMVIGHTHLARAIKMQDSYYVNTGTWAELMRIPKSLSSDDFHESARKIAHHLREPDKAPWYLRPFRRLTYVAIDLKPQASGDPFCVSLNQWCPQPGPLLFQFP